MKPLVRPIVAILCACVLLLGISAFVKNVAVQNAEQERLVTMAYLLPGSTEFTKEAYAGEDANITAVYRGTGGYIVETTIYGYADYITLWVGVKDNGKVSGLTIRELHETSGLGSRAAFEDAFLVQFIGKNSTLSIGEDVDVMSGATVTSKTVIKGVNSAIGFVTGADVGTAPTKWGEW